MQREIRRALEEDWELVREVRLRALLDTPDHFWATYDDEVERPESWWRSFVGPNGWFLAFVDGVPVGLAAGLQDPEGPPTERALISMWVDPAYRGLGIGAELVESVAQWARAQGAETVSLEVTTGNDSARRLYERIGFRMTGKIILHPRNPDLAEHQMTRSL